MKSKNLNPIKLGNTQHRARKLSNSFILLTFILFPTVAFSQLKVSSNGFVGINNNNPSYGLDVEGTGRFSSWTDVYLNWTGLCGSPVLYPQNNWYLQLGKSTNKLGNIFTTGIHTNFVSIQSDANLKMNIQPIESALEIIQSLSGKTYNFTEEYLQEFPEQERPLYGQTQFGFIAEELGDVLPNLVIIDSPTTRSSVNYIAIIPILVEAVKQQQEMINTLANGAVTTGFTKNTEKNQTKGAALFQNIPNPYTEKTEIKFNIPQGGSNPFLIISNLNGEQIKKYNISGSGMQSITIDGGEFAAGSYYYTLVVNNEEVATKKMILVK